MSTETETYYSTNDEDFEYETAEEAAEALWEKGDRKVGDVVEVYEADCRRPLASDILPDVSEILTQQAYSEFDESSDGWEFSDAQSKSLQEAMGKALDAWATENNMQPNFWKVVRSRSVRMKFVGESGESVREPQPSSNP